MKNSYLTLNAILSADPEGVYADLFYAISFTRVDVSLQGHHSPPLVKAIRKLGERLVKEDHVVSDWGEKIDELGYVHIVFALDDKLVKFILT